MSINEVDASQRDPIYIEWIPPPEGYIKPYKNGASSDAAHAGVGGILHGVNGHFLAGFAKYIHKNSNNIIELWAIREGVQLEADIRVKKLIQGMLLTYVYTRAGKRAGRGWLVTNPRVTG
ncbi:hypothetical protein C5167_025599 [Papaver somniferum]|uniref:Uncharacterized protein n=1 Tax=Papaver somniferum TaxID=3469 RepID=A0A4Y7JTH3_PAPSO|nr:hypothetical protein C5167_025599 [Papaver somniferum]